MLGIDICWPACLWADHNNVVIQDFETIQIALEVHINFYTKVNYQVTEALQRFKYFVKHHGI